MSFPQLPLFEVSPQADLQARIRTERLHVKRSTFLGGLTSNVHRWFRLTASYGPELVRRMLIDMNTSPESVVLDPFAGAGTTLIESSFEGHTAIGFEINPLLAFVCKTSSNWDLSSDLAAAELNEIEARFEQLKEYSGFSSLQELGYTVPPIHNIHRWWREDVLRNLVFLLHAIRQSRLNGSYVSFFELALAGVLVPELTNVTLGRLQLFFIDRTNDKIDVWKTFYRHSKLMISDLEEMQFQPGLGQAKVFNVDSTNLELDEALPLIDRVVTSPPYPNRYSYVWNTRPHLYLLGLITHAKQASSLDIRAIGGTWGTATSSLYKGRIEPAFPVIEREIEPIAREIRTKDNLMANYVMKYFNQLARQIVVQDPLLSLKAQLAYVVGCSRIKGVYVETDLLLAKIFEGIDLGYKTKAVERFRRRHSGKDLHESTVYITKS